MNNAWGLVVHCAALTFAFFAIRGVVDLGLLWMPFTCVPPDGVGAEPGVFISSSVLTADGRRLLVPAGDVLALGPLELVPCWLSDGCMPGACIVPIAGLPMCGEPGSWRWAACGLAPIGNWLKLGVRGPPWGMGWPFMFWLAALIVDIYWSSAAYGANPGCE